jgi:hypothetical protein
MSRSIPESDWKLFRQLHTAALERYCERILREIKRMSEDAVHTPHERYLKVYELVEQKNAELGRAFDDVRRSTALTQLTIIYSYGVITEEELMRFTPETRAAISFLSTSLSTSHPISRHVYCVAAFLFLFGGIRPGFPIYHPDFPFDSSPMMGDGSGGELGEQAR